MISIKELKEKLKKSNYELEGLTEKELEIFDKLATLREHKGKLVKNSDEFYLIVEFATNTETEEELVIYKPMSNDNKVYAMPIDKFLYEFECINIKKINN